MYTYHDSPLGPLLLAGTADALTVISFPSGNTRRQHEPDWTASTTPFDQVKYQLDAYFAGELTQFDLRIAPTGTEFQQQVWQALQRIPYGDTCSYSQVAESIKRPAACRAVGGANHVNPIPIVIPCHRVIGKDGHLVGFGGGLSVKEQLLQLERAECVRVPMQQSLF